MMFSTGEAGVDKVITGLRIGDNVVWQVDTISVYRNVATRFVRSTFQCGKRLVYIRFGDHEPLFEQEQVSAIYDLDPYVGFESFSVRVNEILTKEGPGVFYVFDCLSDLITAWSNDLMIGNFFKVTCPFLFEIDTIAYFALLRNSHSFDTVARIRDTTQVLIDIYQNDGDSYIHPLKVWGRHSPTMFFPHMRKGEGYVPVTGSAETARLFAGIFTKELKSVERKLDNWDRLFLKAERLLGKEATVPREREELLDRLARLVISRDENILGLAKANLGLEDLLRIRSRMIGTGFVGGKTVGMLLARNMLLKERSLGAEHFLEAHDSFYVGADVFYTYIVENGWWNDRVKQGARKEYFRLGRTLEKKMLHGKFPEEIKEQFRKMLDYFGQAPIIVRSSSLLEDGFGNAFAGKYESVFLSNQGSPQERLEKFIEAVARVYASTMSQEALSYRLRRGLHKRDEQMALLVQRLSGAFRDKYFFPDLAGVGLSHNIFTWREDLKASAGMLRLVLGFGTRAVDRVDGDYPRLVALDQPLLKAQLDIGDLARFSQHEVDVINTEDNTFETVRLNELLEKDTGLDLSLMAVKDEQASRHLRETGKEHDSWVLTFDGLFSRTSLGPVMQKILSTLEEAYGEHVDIEFTVNLKKDEGFHINILQCRPQATQVLGDKVSFPAKVAEEKVLFSSEGHFLGGNISLGLDRIIYVDPGAYCELSSISEKYDIARAVGAINRKIAGKQDMNVMLLGPGRWGTTTPSVGVPVSFAEISNMSILGEIAFSANNVMPELSYGSHFFQDLVESRIFYLALFPESPDVRFNDSFFAAFSSLLAEELPRYEKYAEVIQIFDLKGSGVRICADIKTQQVLCYFSS